MTAASNDREQPDEVIQEVVIARCVRTRTTILRGGGTGGERNDRRIAAEGDTDQELGQPQDPQRRVPLVESEIPPLIDEVPGDVPLPAGISRRWKWVVAVVVQVSAAVVGTLEARKGSPPPKPATIEAGKPAPRQQTSLEPGCVKFAAWTPTHSTGPTFIVTVEVEKELLTRKDLWIGSIRMGEPSMLLLQGARLVTPTSERVVILGPEHRKLTQSMKYQLCICVSEKGTLNGGEVRLSEARRYGLEILETHTVERSE